MREASVVSVIVNRAQEGRFLDAEDVYVAPALGGIIDGLQMLLGNDIFTAQDDESGGTVSEIERPPKLARIYKGSAKNIAIREDIDPPNATHRFAGKTVRAWGAFEGPEPDVRFRVFAGSSWRPASSIPVMQCSNNSSELPKRKQVSPGKAYSTKRHTRW